MGNNPRGYLLLRGNRRGAIRAAKKEFPEATNLGPVQDIDTLLLDTILMERPFGTRVLACAGPPCVGVSKLNKFRKQGSWTKRLT